MGLDVQVHDLKCWDAFFKDIVAGFKTFDIRKDDDRGYRVGDYLRLREWYPGDEAYSGRVAMVRVTAIFSNAVNPLPVQMIMPGMVVMGIKVLDPQI